MSALHGRSLLTLLDYSPEEIAFLIARARELKKQCAEETPPRLHEGKSIALLFEKPSTRTRCAFELAAHKLGIHTVTLDSANSQIGKKESMEDTARVLGRMFDGIEYRGFGQTRAETLAAHSGVPVWNGLTDEYHPTQILADLMTIEEHFGSLRGKKLVFLGDARFNMASSQMIGCAKMGMEFTACAPEEYLPGAALRARCEEIAAQTGAVLRFETDPAVAVQNADVVYTDVWVSMGESEEVWSERISRLVPYRVDSALMRKAKDSAIFMHCLPAFHDRSTTIGEQIYERFGLECMEVTDEVFRSAQSFAFSLAENRLYTIMAILAETL